MNKLVIIDDEAYILKQLQSLIDWQEINFEVTDLLESSEYIFDYLKDHEVDVILSDISMPHPDGLEIARHCQEQYPHIKVVLLSGYRNFTYAQDAIRYGVYQYITKPISYDSFYECMKSLSKQIAQTKHSENHYFIGDSKLTSFQEIFFDLFFGRITNVGQLEQSIIACGFDTHMLYTPFYILTMQIQNFDVFLKHNRKYDIHKLYTMLCNLIPYETNDTWNLLIRYTHNTSEILLISKQETLPFDLVQNQIRSICDSLKTTLNIQVEISLAKSYPSMAYLISGQTVTAKISSAESSLKTLAAPTEAVVNEVISKVHDYIAEHFREEITLDDIARHTAMSKGYFCSYYKNITQESFITTLNNYRIDQAKVLLRDPNVKPSLVGNLVGFHNNQHFYRVFKAITNDTPSNYQMKVIEHE